MRKGLTWLQVDTMITSNVDKTAEACDGFVLNCLVPATVEHQTVFFVTDLV